MTERITGNYQISSIGGETIRAFVPFPLPPQPPLDLSGTRQRLLEQATHALGQLDSITTLLPNPHLFLYSYIRREAVLSSQIEGTQSSLSDLLLFELEESPGVPLDDVQEVSHYVAALEYGMLRLREGFPLCNRLLREIHGKLMQQARGREKLPGEFRSSQNWIGGTRPGNARFVPPPPHELEACMGALEQFLHAENDGLPTLLRAALAHVQFETIHPFLDGNGRLGRLLIALLLHHGGLLSQPLLYLSLYFKTHRSLYYEHLDRVRSHGEWEAWVDFFLEGVLTTARAAVNTARCLDQCYAEDWERVHRSGSASVTHAPLRVLIRLRDRPISNIKQLSETSGLSIPTTTKALHSLIQHGVVQELTGQRRNRVFVYGKYLQLLNEGSDA